jgi:predicted nucleotidyltransferase
MIQGKTRAVEQGIELSNTLNLVKNQLTTLFGTNLVSAVVYGSAMTEDYCELSDIDILVILRDAPINSLLLLRDLKNEFLLNGTNIDFNLQILSELPGSRGKAYWHNNRAYYFQKEINLFGKILIGENQYPFENIEDKDLRLECLRVVNSLVYQTRKAIINRELSPIERVVIIKHCIYAVLYALAFRGTFPASKKEALQIFRMNFSHLIDPEIFLNIKTGHPLTIRDDEIEKAYSFLQSLDCELYSQYEGFQ